MNAQKKYDLMHQRAEALDRAKAALAAGDQQEYEKEMETAKGLGAQIDAWNALEEAEKEHVLATPKQIAGGQGEKGKEARYQQAVEEFKTAAQFGFNVSKAIQAGQMFNTQVDEDGGYLVPEDISTEIHEMAHQEESLLNEVTVYKVSALTGKRTLYKRGEQTGFATVEEAAEYPMLNTPDFEMVSYAIEKRGGVTAITAELLRATGDKMLAFVQRWLSDKARVTANRLILDAIKLKEEEALNGLDGILNAWIKLGAAYRTGAKLITNNDGLAWLGTLKDKNGGYLLTPVLNEPGALQFAVGPNVLQVKVYDNATIPSTGTKVPMIIGNLKNGIAYWEMDTFALLMTNVGSAGNVNAYSQNLTLLRGTMWSDCTGWDTDAYINGYVDTAAAAAD